MQKRTAHLFAAIFLLASLNAGATAKSSARIEMFGVGFAAPEINGENNVSSATPQNGNVLWASNGVLNIPIVHIPITGWLP